MSQSGNFHYNLLKQALLRGKLCIRGWFQSGASAQQRRQPDLTTTLFNEGVLLAKSLFIGALCACPSSGLRRGVQRTQSTKDSIHNMTKKSVQALLEDIRLVSEQNYEIVEAVRALVKKNFETTSEEVKYGGILFRSGVQFGGVFAYKAHVTVEFGNGAKITDTFGFLEGSGKGRRHVKLMSVAQIKDKKLAQYLSLALQASIQGDS